MSPRAVLDVAQSPVPAVPVKKLKDYIRKQPKRGGVSAEVASRLAGERRRRHARLNRSVVARLRVPHRGIGRLTEVNICSMMGVLAQ